MKSMLYLILAVILISSASAYSYNVTSEFDGCLAACLDWISGANDNCMVDNGNYTIEDCTNITIYPRLYAKDPNDFSQMEDGMVSNVRPNENFGGSGHYAYIAGGTETFREEVKPNDDFIKSHTNVLNGTIESYQLFFYISQNSLLAPHYVEVWKIAQANDWIEDEFTWNNRTSLLDWAGSVGLNTSGTDYYASENYSRNFSTSITGWVNWTLNTSWFTDDLEGVSTGMKMKLDTDELGSNTGTLRFDSGGAGSYQPYLKLEISGVNITAKSQYNLTGGYGIIIRANTQLDCNNVTLFGNGTAGTGVYYYRYGGNMTVKNCIAKNFTNYGFSLDTFFDSLTDKAYNLTSYNADISFVGDWLEVNNMVCYGCCVNFLEYSGAGVSTYKNTFSYNTTGTCRFDQCTNVNANNYTLTTNHPGVAFELLSGGNINLSGLYLDGRGVSTKGINQGYYSNRIINSEIKNINGTCIENVGNYYNLSISNCINGVSAGMNIILTNSNITNCSEEALYLDGSSQGFSFGSVQNNQFINSGKTSTTSKFLKSASPKCYGGLCYDQYFPIMISADLGTILPLITNDFDVSLVANGADSFELCLTDLPGAGVGRDTFYIKEGGAASCAFLNAVYGGTIGLSSSGYYTGAGNANYTKDTIAGLTVVGGYTDPPYLKYLTINTQSHYPVQIITGDNWLNLSGNIIYNPDGRTTYNQINITADDDKESNLWLNHFDIAGAGVLYSNLYDVCIGGEGNFYEETLTPEPTDCGQSVITYPLNYLIEDCNSTMTWTAQSSIFNITYSVFHSVDAGAWSLIGNTTNLSMDITGNIDEVGGNNYRLIPNDGYVNGTNIIESNITTSTISYLYPRSYNWIRPTTSEIC